MPGSATGRVRPAVRWTISMPSLMRRDWPGLSRGCICITRAGSSPPCSRCRGWSSCLTVSGCRLPVGYGRGGGVAGPTTAAPLPEASSDPGGDHRGGVGDLCGVSDRSAQVMPASYGVVDTWLKVGGIGTRHPQGVQHISDPFAAMPSLHMGWSVWAALALAPAVDRLAG